MWERLDAPTDNLGLDYTICMGVSEADILLNVVHTQSGSSRKLILLERSYPPLGGLRIRVLFFRAGLAISVRLLQPRWGITRLRSR